LAIHSIDGNNRSETALADTNSNDLTFCSRPNDFSDSVSGCVGTNSEISLTIQNSRSSIEASTLARNFSLQNQSQRRGSEIVVELSNLLDGENGGENTVSAEQISENFSTNQGAGGQHTSISSSSLGTQSDSASIQNRSSDPSEAGNTGVLFTEEKEK